MSDGVQIDTSLQRREYRRYSIGSARRRLRVVPRRLECCEVGYSPTCGQKFTILLGYYLEAAGSTPRLPPIVSSVSHLIKTGMSSVSSWIPREVVLSL